MMATPVMPVAASVATAAGCKTPASARLSGQKWLERRANSSVSLLAMGALTALLLLSGCGSAPKKHEPVKPASPASSPTSGKYYLDDGPGDNPPPNLDLIPDAVPKDEPLHRGANKPYTVFGKTYVPNVSTQPFRQQGIASWYGRKFHGQKTSNGEIYDMYAMTAAHPTLPLPSYARVTNPANMKSVVVRVNDRGPFHSDRIMDLSYAAAAKLDLARKGSGLVIVERVFPGEVLMASAPPPMSMAPASPSPGQPAAPPAPLAPVPLPLPTLEPEPKPVATIPPVSPIVPEVSALFLQLGAFSSMENAEIFRTRMARELDWNREPIQVLFKDGLYRVRLGPYKTREEAEAIAQQVKDSHDFSPVITKP
jgi:rare lipoprotein A